MNASTPRCLFLWAAIFLLLPASACAPVEPLSPTTRTLTVERATQTPLNTPVLLPFPTVTAPVQTAPAATATLIPSPGSARAASAPIVQIVAPISNTQISLNQTIYVVAYTVSDASIARVDLFDDNHLVRSESAPSPPPPSFPAILPWTPATIGAHVLRVVAFDTNNVASAPEEVVVSVTPNVRRPSALILFPVGTPQVELGSVVQIYAAATDEVGVTQLDLYVDNQLYTYALPQNVIAGQSPFSFAFAWTPTTPGNHTLFVRAHDTQDQTTDSAQLRVFVVDLHAPVLKVNFDRTNVLAGEPITVTVTALDVSGVQRVELWSGREISYTLTSASPARQTSMAVQFAWQHGVPGDYTLSARAYNANGNVKESPVQVVSVLRAGQSTPTRAPTPTPSRTRTPRPLPTPRLQPPAPPRAEILQPPDRFSNQYPVRVVFSGQGSGELDRIELWGYYPGQSNPQVICSIDAHATTHKTGQCDWSPTQAGTVSLFAQVIDIYRQAGRSSTISGYIGVPALPTPTPTPASLVGRWSAPVPAGLYTVTFRHIVTASGIALRGDFKINTAATPTLETIGRITSGSLRGDKATFRVEFTPATPPPPPAETPAPTSVATPPAPTLDFDCAIDTSGVVLDCKYKDARGQTGNAAFKREP